jgi:serine/threonine protein kinase
MEVGALQLSLNFVLILQPLLLHPNVVQVFGVSLDGPQPVIILEYCAGGINRIKSNHKHSSQFFI